MGRTQIIAQGIGVTGVCLGLVVGIAGPALASPGELRSPGQVGVSGSGWVLKSKDTKSAAKKREWVLPGGAGRLRVVQTQFSRGDTPDDLTDSTQIEAVLVSGGVGGQVLARGFQCQRFKKGKVCILATTDGQPWEVIPRGSTATVRVYAVGARSKRGYAWASVAATGTAMPADLGSMVAAVQKGAVAASASSWQ